MLAKILVGVLAAVMVSGAGVYFAFSDSGSCDHRCSGSTDVTVSEGSGCTKGCCAGHDDEECTEGKACSADATGACLGGAALSAKKGACCDE